MARKKLLIIDNSPSITDCLVAAFSLHYDFLTAKTAYEGVAQAIHEQPDCILTGSLLPQICGGMLCEILHMLPPTQSIPIVRFRQDPDTSISDATKQEVQPMSPSSQVLTLKEIAERITSFL